LQSKDMRNSKSYKTKLVNGVRFIEGSDNIFRDLGFSEVEAVNLIVRSKLMMVVETVIKKRGLTQAEAAKILGVGQPRVSDLFKGKIDRFTIDMLMKWLHKLGKEVTISVRDRVAA
jgi:predicted XRE-type DNA-binding protein